MLGSHVEAHWMTREQKGSRAHANRPGRCRTAAVTRSQRAPENGNAFVSFEGIVGGRCGKLQTFALIHDSFRIVGP